MTERVNLYIDQGTTFNTEVELFQDSLELNVDGFDFYSSIRKLYSSASNIDFFITKDSNTNNIQLSLTPDVTSSMTPGKYLYDVLMVDTNSGTSTKILEGLVFVVETMTRSANT